MVVAVSEKRKGGKNPYLGRQNDYCADIFVLSCFTGMPGLGGAFFGTAPLYADSGRVVFSGIFFPKGLFIQTARCNVGYTPACFQRDVTKKVYQPPDVLRVSDWNDIFLYRSPSWDFIWSSWKFPGIYPYSGRRALSKRRAGWRAAWPGFRTFLFFAIKRIPFGDSFYNCIFIHQWNSLELLL